MEARDHAAVVATFAPGIVLNSPIITPRFEGRAAVSDLYAAILESFDEYEYTSEMEGSGLQMLGFRARFGKRWVDGVDMLRVDEEGQIVEMTVMFRRLVGVATVAAALGPPLARRKGRLYGLVMRVLGPPLPVLLSVFDLVAPRFIRLRA
jgi:hypothetical protein